MLYLPYQDSESDAFITEIIILILQVWPIQHPDTLNLLKWVKFCSGHNKLACLML